MAQEEEKVEVEAVVAGVAEVEATGEVGTTGEGIGGVEAEEEAEGAAEATEVILQTQNLRIPMQLLIFSVSGLK